MCKSCEALVVNGVLCHESGCPDSWRGTVRECQWCGSEFVPENKRQDFCCVDCAVEYLN